MDATCPFCQEPSEIGADDEKAADYFAKLGDVLQPILEEDVMKTLRRKVREHSIMKDPNFRWCYKVGT